MDKYYDSYTCKQKLESSPYSADSILTLKQVAEALQLDQRTVRRIISEIGGKRIGTCWRFRWGTVMEYFSDANFEKRSRECLAGKGHNRRQNSGHQIFPGGPQKRPGMDGRKAMGDGKEKGTAGRTEKERDPHGLRSALGLG